MENQTKVILGIIIVSAALLGGLVLWAAKNSKPPIVAKQVDKAELVRENSHTTGPADAKVTIVEFGDFQCPACGAAYPEVEKIKTDYKDRVKFVYRQFPLSSIHPNAEITAKAAEAAGKQGRFWEMYAKLFESQKDWSTLPSAKKTLTRYAGELGLNEKTFESDLDSQATIDTISQDKGDGEALGVDSTPTFYINGEKHTGGSNYASFKNKIDQLLQ